MRVLIAVAVCLCGVSGSGWAQPSDELSGEWVLNAERSQIGSLPESPASYLKVRHDGSLLHVSEGPQQGGPFTTWTIAVDGKETKRQAGGASYSTMTKWEGAALLTNTLVNGAQSYTVMDRWRRSRDGSRLTITRTIVRLGHESESVLVYENALQPAAAKNAPAVQERAALPVARGAANSTPAGDYVLEAGTRILLALVSPLNTRHASTGDRVYLETAYPIMGNGRVIVPKGSYVAGTVTESQRPGRVKGKASLYVRFDSLTLPNGVTRDFRSRLGGADADWDRSEGKLKGEGDKGKDAGTVAKTTSAGASVGTIAGGAAGHMGMGAGIGAAAGAAAGLIGVLASRGPDLILPKGSTMEMVLDRELRFTSEELQMSGSR